MVFIKNTGKKVSFFLMGTVHFLYGMEMVLEPFIPYDCIEKIVCEAYVVPVVKLCRKIVAHPYDQYNISLYDKLIDRYKKIESLATVCKCAKKLLDEKWYKANKESRRRCLLLTHHDCDVFLQKVVAYQHADSFYFARMIGANVNAPILFEDSYGMFLQGATAIFIAVYNGDVAMVKRLLKEGAITNIVSYGFLTLEQVAKAIMDTYRKTEERIAYQEILEILRKKRRS